MLRRLYTLAALIVLLAACEPAPTPPPPPTVIAFPTATPGRFLQGPLPAAPALVTQGDLANPATAVALVNQPTPAPDYAACPSGDGVQLASAPESARVMLDDITRSLNGGTTAVMLDSALREVWQVGSLRADFDLTGEGVNDLLISLDTPDEGGTFVIYTCGDGRYSPRYLWSSGGETPEVIRVGDMNVDQRPEVVVTSEVCDDDDLCAYHTQIATWDATLGRFVSLLDRDLESADVPVIEDVDDDQIAELDVQIGSRGNAQTGPLRTGTALYDWNGAGYVESITQIDPPAFRIQVIHEADRALARQNMPEAINLYTLALNSPGLATWRDSEEPILRSYSLFRLLLTHAVVGDDEGQAVYDRILAEFSDPATAPVYVPLSTTFWNAVLVTNSVQSACLEVRGEIEDTRREAMELLNRYGSRSPVYDETTICPF